MKVYGPDKSVDPPEPEYDDYNLPIRGMEKDAPTLFTHEFIVGFFIGFCVGGILLGAVI